MQVNPLAGCLPALVQIPVFLALYRSFLDLAQGGKLDEPFLWLPNLDGPIYGARSTDWLLKGWQDGVPSLGWHDTLCFLTLPIILIVAQTISLRVLTPPSDDPAVQQSQVTDKAVSSSSFICTSSSDSRLYEHYSPSSSLPPPVRSEF